MAKTDYTREDLIAICERAIVPQDHWRNRDSASAQLGVGAALVLLKAGCKFVVLTADNQERPSLVTDAETIWLEFYLHNFQWFEYGGDDHPDGYRHEDTVYLPTPARLDVANGGDWY